LQEEIFDTAKFLEFDDFCDFANFEELHINTLEFNNFLAELADLEDELERESNCGTYYTENYYCHSPVSEILYENSTYYQKIEDDIARTESNLEKLEAKHNLFYNANRKEVEIKAVLDEASKFIETERKKSVGELKLFEEENFSVIAQLSRTLKWKQQLDEMEKDFRKALETAMRKRNIKKFVSEHKFLGSNLVLTRIDETEQTRLDSGLIKEKYPEIASECSKITKTKPHVKIEFKEMQTI
jgi:predicted DNA-binding protein YlxM (UPF0122 family)